MNKLITALKKDGLLWILSGLTIGVFTVLAVLSDRLAGGSDSFGHYLISRYAFVHQQLLVDQWGKPFFTLISSPFSRLWGMNGLVAYNILMATGTGVLAYFTSKKLDFKYPILAFLMVCYAPGFFNNVVSGLTELTGAFVLMLFIYLYVNKRMVWASIFISFLPFVRSEGFIILAVVAVYYVIKKHYRHLGLLATGSLLYSVFAFVKVNNIVWLFGENPYLAQPDGVYGSGSFWHYTGLHEAISGNPVTILWLVGVVYICYKYVQVLKTKTDEHFTSFKFLVVIGSFITFAFVHSYIWWKGSLGSAGFPRVFAAVLPLMVLIAMEAVTLLADKIKRVPVRNGVMLFIGVLVVANNFIVNKLPYHEKPLDKQIKRVSAWVHEQGYDTDTTKIYHLMPAMNVYLNMDPYDDKKIHYLFGFDVNHAKPGELVIWDGLFCPNDARIPLSSLEGNPNFELVKVFNWEARKTADNAHLWVYVFRRK